MLGIQKRQILLPAGKFHSSEAGVLLRIRWRPCCAPGGTIAQASPLSFKEVSRELAEVEGTALRNPDLDRRADYLVQLLKILGLAEFEGKDDRKLLYIIHP